MISARIWVSATPIRTSTPRWRRFWPCAKLGRSLAAVTVNVANAAKFMAQGYRIINFGSAGGGLSAANEAARDAALKAGAKR